MKLWDNIKAGLGKVGTKLQTLFAGRYGWDQLSRTMLWIGIAFYILDLFLRTGLLTLLGTVVYALVLFRMLSKNKEKRAAENRKYQARVGGVRTKFSQAKARFTNRKEYKYVHCPNCKAWIRLPRGAGNLSVRCRSCGHAFEQKT